MSDHIRGSRKTENLFFLDDFAATTSDNNPETIYCIVERYISDWAGHQMNVGAFCSFFRCATMKLQIISTRRKKFSFFGNIIACDGISKCVNSCLC
jgi:hypothetical protein